MSSSLIELLVNNSIEIDWNNKKVWIGILVAETLGYDNPSKIVNYFIRKSNLVEETDYKILRGSELRSFKSKIHLMGITKYKQSPSLLLFYEEAYRMFLRQVVKLDDKDIDNLLKVSKIKDNKQLQLYEDESCLGENYKENNLVDKQVIKNFNGFNIHTYTWNGKPCWMANDIAKVLNYQDESTTINKCINSEGFEVGYEYEVLNGARLDKFKKDIEKFSVPSIKYFSKLTIFYEDGLYGFLQYSHKPIAIEFKKWIRREVLPELRETGSYSINNNLKTEIYEDKYENNLTKKVEDRLRKSENLNLVLEVLNLVDKITSKENENKLRYIKDILDV